MCGIAGVWNATQPPEASAVRLMADAISHRGPDGDGVFTDGPIGLGHRRLAIVDLSAAGRQPMSSGDGRFTITYNGEIYNFKELREELETLGQSFRSGTDTEVVLGAFAAWGKDCVHRFNGMFAFAIWDRETRSLFLARDRYGIKPLYYRNEPSGGRFLFASEIKGILAAEGVEKRVDLHALREYFTFQNLYSDRTLFDGIRMMPPGHTATLTPDGTFAVERYWDFRLRSKDDAPPFERCAEEVRRRFEKAVERQLMTDVPLGSHLSAGMDSGSIAAVANKHLPRLPTFTGGFDTREADGFEISADEREGAEELSSHLRTEHYEMVMHAGDMQWVLPRLVWHLEDLRMGMSWPNFYVDRLASRFVKVALTGTGGDELFGGYPWRYAKAATDPDTFDDRYFAYWQRLIPAAEHDRLFRPEVMAATADFDARGIFRAVFANAENLPDDPRDRALYFDLKTFLHGLLVIQDKISMAHGLEARVPFLDNDLVDLALALPASYKMGDVTALPGEGHIRSSQGKKILRQAMRGLLPPSAVSRQKQGFSAPDGSWYRGPSLVYVHETLLGEDSRCTQFLAPSFIKRLIAEHWIGSVEHRLLLWSLLSFEWWLRVFNPLPPESPPEERHEDRRAPIVSRRARSLRPVPRVPAAGDVLPLATVSGLPAPAAGRARRHTRGRARRRTGRGPTADER